MTLPQIREASMLRTLLSSTPSMRALRWGIAAFFVLLPAVAMQFTNEVNWTLGDFVFASILLFGSCAMFEWASRASSNASYRLGCAMAIGGCLAVTWANLAVGIIGNENEDLNLLFLGLPLIALIGAALSRFKPQGLQRTLYVMIAVQVIICVIALIQGHMIIPFTVVLTLWWLAASVLVGKSVQKSEIVAQPSL